MKSNHVQIKMTFEYENLRGTHTGEKFFKVTSALSCQDVIFINTKSFSSTNFERFSSYLTLQYRLERISGYTISPGWAGLKHDNFTFKMAAIWWCHKNLGTLTELRVRFWLFGTFFRKLKDETDTLHLGAYCFQVLDQILIMLW